MSGKAKMRCAHCHKPFKASSAKQTLCADCEAKERRARAMAKAAPTTADAAAPVVKPKIVGPGANILVPGLVPPPAPPSHPSPPAAAPHDGRAARDAQPGSYRPQQAAEHGHEYGHGPGSAGPGRAYPHPQQQAHGGAPTYGRPRPQQRSGPPRPPTQPRSRKEPAPVITLTPELRERIETRYRELAQPVEFDGIRTRIATELAVPKSLVKKTVLELRQRDQMPSWWELQGYHGSEEELERIRAAYTPHLPLPAVGVHKQLATNLGLDPGAVYQAIRRIRAEMRLPQYNPPESHAAEAGGASDENAGNAESAEAVQSVPTPAHATASAAASTNATATPQAPETPAG